MTGRHWHHKSVPPPCRAVQCPAWHVAELATSWARTLFLPTASVGAEGCWRLWGSPCAGCRAGQGGLECRVGQGPACPCGPRPPGQFPNSAQQEVPGNQTGAPALPMAHPANTGLSHLRSNNGALWWPRPGLPGSRPACTDSRAAPLVSPGVHRLSGSWRPGQSCLCGQGWKRGQS